MRGLIMVAMLASSAFPAVSQAQAKPDPFTIDSNTMKGRSLPAATDKRVGTNVGIRGALLEVVGKPWFQILGYCAGVYKFHDEELQKKGDVDAARASAKAGQQFMGIAATRLQEDRGISFEAGVNIAGAEMEYGRLGASQGGETYRPFALDDKRCQDVKYGYIATFKPPR